MSELKFVKLANNMVTIQGICNGCGNSVLKGKMLPNTGKNPLPKCKMKLNTRRLNIYFKKGTFYLPTNLNKGGSDGRFND